MYLMNPHAAEWDRTSQRQRNSSDKWHERREQIMRAETDFWTNSDNVLKLANELVESGRLGVSKDPDKACKELLYFFSKPWKWSAEWSYLAKNKTLDGFGE